MGKITAIAISAEEITGQEGCQAFSGVDKRGTYAFTMSMNAIAGTTIELTASSIESYDYKDTYYRYSWCKNWLKDIKEEVNWSKVTVDAKVLVNSNEGILERHFAKYKSGRVFTFLDGKTSWSSKEHPIGWSPDRVELVEEK